VISNKTITFTLGLQSTNAVTDAFGVANVSMVVTQDVGSNYTVSAKFAGDCPFLGSTNSKAFTIVPACVSSLSSSGLASNKFYIGTTFAWTTSTNSSTATLTLSAGLRNCAGMFGDIRKARVTFATRNAGGGWTAIPSAQNLPVNLVDPGDSSAGTGDDRCAMEHRFAG
jgi:hypothetical protein